MGVKGDNLELISGLLWSSFILNYMVTRVKEKGFGIRKIERTARERGETIDRSREERRGQQSFGELACLIAILRWR